METSCCRADVSVIEDVDVPVGRLAMAHLLEEVQRCGIELVVWTLMDDRVMASPVEPQTVHAMSLHCRQVWMVKRPSCFGLVTRLVFTDALGQSRWCVGARRSAGAPEPVSWRIALALSLSRVVAESSPVRAAG